MVRGLSRMCALSDWPHGYAASVVDVWSIIEAESYALREAE